MMRRDRLTVIHSFPLWLPQTQVWMHTQVRFLPPEVESHIVCEETANLDQFWLPNIHSLSEVSPVRRYWNKGLRKLRVRRHLGYLTSVAQRQQADILHSNFGNIGWENLGAVKQAGLKHVVSFYGHDVDYLPKVAPRWHARYEKLFEEVGCVLCLGPRMERRLVELGCPPHKVRVHHFATDVSGTVFRPRVWSPGTPLRVLLVASFREKKGLPYALESLGRLQREVPLEITVVGDALDTAQGQAEKRKILGTIEKHGLGDRTRLMGYQPNTVVFEEAYRHHVFISPSVTASDGDTEGTPMALIEMAATGMPIISTFHSDIPEIIVHGVTGLLAQERDIGGLEKHLTWLVENPGLWNDMVEAGRRHVETHFDARKQGDKLAGIYREQSGS